MNIKTLFKVLPIYEFVLIFIGFIIGGIIGAFTSISHIIFFVVFFLIGYFVLDKFVYLITKKKE